MQKIKEHFWDGVSRYYKEYYKCQCCGKVKHRREFRQYSKTTEHTTFSVVCKDCRKPDRKSEKVKRAKDPDFDPCEDITCPSIIDWMYKNANG